MRGIFGSCAIAAFVLGLAWASPLHVHETETTSHKLAAPNADFVFALYKNLKAQTAAGENIFFSPVGITTALAMLSVGARGETHSQLFDALRYTANNLTQAQVNQAYEHLVHMLAHHQDGQIDVGNALALRTGFKPDKQFMDYIKRFYNGETFDVNFANPAEAVKDINNFIASKTQNKITEQVKDLDPETVMVLINYVFFKGQWEKPFDPTLTKKDEFHVDETTKVEVDMMWRTGRYDFYQDNNATVVLLPYKTNTSMMIVLPDEGKMEEVEGYVNKDYIRNWHDSLYRSSVDLFLPKMSISADASLGEMLKRMGVANAFEDTADFSGITKDIGLKVSKVSHKAVLSVDEKGTEAASSTVIDIMPMSMPNTVKLNRPFLVFILQHNTKSILFMGKISNPTAN
ncbi:alpha-1-antitrypsin homolog [Lampris incognitus]|uniref:alpha-1-antitrypsin homolog n=1 Tax=Lampris incognitus TaxID=2546036 RepID=UPI0024B5A555|nr:alpha-1-antitrypsin homolog [Lampris incognitus]